MSDVVISKTTSLKSMIKKIVIYFTCDTRAGTTLWKVAGRKKKVKAQTFDISAGQTPPTVI